jgi:streptomycin 6-kinase
VPEDAEVTVPALPANLRWMLEPGSPARSWVSGLPSVIADLTRRWSVRVGRPFQPGGSTSWVAPATDSRGNRLVLKVGRLHDEARHEADGLRAWAGNGAVRLHRAEQFGRTSALLLEEIRPGTTLSEALPPAERDEVVAALLPRLWIDPPAGHPFRPLRSMAEAWAAEFRARPFVPPDPGWARAGLDLWLGLPATATRNVLLCTDLHPDNVLAAHREPWLVIDPKPYLGDPAYEPIQHMLNFPERLIAGPGAFADRMAGLLDLDAARVRRYLFARCVLEAPESPELWSVVRDLAP